MDKVEFYEELQWDDIKIGQSFFFEGCTGLGVKISDTEFFIYDIVGTHGLHWDDLAGELTPNRYLYIENCRYYDISDELKEALETI